MAINVQEEAKKWGLSKCPYCFKPFNPFAAAFRSMTVYNQQDMDDFSPEEMEQKKGFFEKEDAVYEDFWKKYPGSKPTGKIGNRISQTYDHYPIIANMWPQYLTGQFQLDEDGFPHAMMDSEGKLTKIRVCPHCHNRLPFEFGKYPVKYIAVVGITSSGKTVYLSQFFKRISDYATALGLSVIGSYDEIEDFVQNNRIARGVLLPTGNATDKLTLPLPINVRSTVDNRRYTLVFYDIAGENCVRSEQIEKYGPFIENANGIVVIIDPKQFGDLFDLEDDDDDEIVRPSKVVEAMYNAFLSANNKGGKSNVPIAIAFSKSDLLADYCEQRYQDARKSSIFRQINYADYDGFGFAQNDFAQINHEISEMLGRKGLNYMKGLTFMNTLDNYFTNKGFFAFSALGASAVVGAKDDEERSARYTMDEAPRPMRVEEPVAWILAENGVVRRSVKKGTGAQAAPEKKKQENRKSGGLFGLGRRHE